MKYFVNEAFEEGIKAYIAKSNNQKYAKKYEFELIIIETLVEIYDQIDILNPYKLRDVNSLRKNFAVYGASFNEINELFRLLDEYKKWYSSPKKEASDILENIFKILSSFVLLKYNSVVISSSEMKYYEDFFNLENDYLKKTASLMKEDYQTVINIFPQMRANSKNRFAKAKKDFILFDDAEYQRYGLDVDEVKDLSDTKLLELNYQIKIRDEIAKKKRKKTSNFVLSSGNGFIDGLILFSIICTEIMVGIVITIIIRRF